MRSGGRNFPTIEFPGLKSPDLAFSNVDRYGCPFSAITNRTRDPLWSLVFQSYYHLKKDLLAFRHCYVTMSIERPIIKKKLRYLQKKPLNALCEEIAVFNV